MKPIDPEILANRARLEIEIQERRDARRFSAGRFIITLLLADVVLIAVCSLF